MVTVQYWSQAVLVYKRLRGSISFFLYHSFYSIYFCIELNGEMLICPSCPYVHHDSMMVSQLIPPEGLMVTHIQQRFLPLAFIPLNTWIVSQYFELWKVKDLTSLQSFAKNHCLWTNWQFSHKVWHKVVNHDPSSLAKILLLYSILITSPVTS